MKKLGLWAFLTIVFSVVLHKFTVFITKRWPATFFDDYDALLVILGFASVFATIIICTMIIVEQIKKK